MRDPALPDTRYVDELIGPPTVSTMPPTTLAAVSDHGLPAASEVLTRLGQVGSDLDAVSAALEDEGIESFTQAFVALRGVLAAKAAALLGQETASA